MNKLDNIIANAQNEVFYDGMDSVFSIRLHELVKEHGKIVIEDLHKRFIEGRLTGSVACESMIQCGHVEDKELEQEILHFAHHALQHKELAIRDGAMLAIASIDNPVMITHIREAVANETNEEVKKDLIQVLNQLLETLKESSEDKE